MYLRTVKAKGGEGKTYEYIRLVDAYWEDGRSKQRVVANLGRKDLLKPHLESLIRILGGDDPPSRRKVGDIEFDDAATWGRMLIAATLWRELGLDDILDQLEVRDRKRGRPSSQDKLRLSDRALVLVAHRLAAPGSEHSLADWLETDYVCGRDGQRLQPVWKQRGRVRVDLSWLQGWYRTLDDLVEHKESIEVELFHRLRDLFSLEPELVFYDLTSTYFEGHGPAEISRHGHSRDGKPRNRQILIGVVMANGWPIAHHVFRGNMRDALTVEKIVEDLEARLGLKRVVFVGDRGMVTTASIAAIKDNEQGYLVGLQRRRRQRVFELIERATGEWQECPLGVSASEKKEPPKTLVQEVESDEEGLRVFVVHSEERAAYERGMREQSMERTRTALESLAQRVRSGRLKKPEKIGQAAGRILSRNHGHRYYTWSLNDGLFEFQEHPVHLSRELAYEGKYLIQTEEKDLSPVEAVAAYKQLCDVERGFRELKDVLEMRPVYHRSKNRVEAHVFVAALALLLDRALDKKLKAAKIPLSSPQALTAAKTVHVVDIGVDGSPKRGVTAGSKRARQVLAALGIGHDERNLPVAHNPRKQAAATT